MGQLQWTVDAGVIHFTVRGKTVVQRTRFRRIAFVPDFVLIEEEDGIVRGRQSHCIFGIEFDKKG